MSWEGVVPSTSPAPTQPFLYSVKVAPGHGGRVKRALLVNDKANGAEPAKEPQQFIEVSIDGF